MKTFTVKVCCGTTCYVMGGSDLLTLEDHLPPELIGYVTVKGSPCLGFCNAPENGRAPFVTINGDMLGDASLAKVLEYLRHHR